MYWKPCWLPGPILLLLKVCPTNTKNGADLSKKQLEGLYQKALKVESIPDGKLATLEAVIMKKPTRYKSAPPPPKAIVQ